MSTIYVLTMIIMGGMAGSPRPVALTAEYYTQSNCHAALEQNRQALTDGRVIMATCTRK